MSPLHKVKAISRAVHAAPPRFKTCVRSENRDILHFCRCVVWTRAFGTSDGHGNSTNVECSRFVSAERMRELDNDGERRGLQSPFDLTHVGSMDPCLEAEFLLRKASNLAKVADLVSK